MFSLRVASRSLVRVASRSLTPSGIAIARRAPLQTTAWLKSARFKLPEVPSWHGSGLLSETAIWATKNFERRPSLFRLRRRSKWENEWGQTTRNGQVYAATANGPNESVFGEACHGNFFHLGLLIFFQAARNSTVQWFDKKIRNVPQVSSTTIDKCPSQTQKCM